MAAITSSDTSASEGITSPVSLAAPKNAPPRLGPSGITVALAVLAAIYLLKFTPYKIENPGSFYFTLVVYTAINNGLRQGLVVAMATWCFSVFFTTTTQPPDRWVADYQTRWTLLAINLTAIAILVGVLQKRARKLSDGQMAAQYTEVALRQSRDWLATTMQSIGDALVATDADGRITYINGAAEQLTGWRGIEVTGRSPEDIFKLVHAQTGEAVESPVKRALREGDVISLSNNVCLITRDERQIPIDDSASPIRDASGKIIGAVAVFRDVSARKAAAKALERSETLFRATIEESPIAILICNADGSVLRTNRAWEKLYDVSRDHLHDYNIRTDPQLAALGHSPVIERCFAGESVYLPLIHYHPAKINKPGRARWISTIAYPVKDAEGNVTEVVLMIEDVTDRQQTLEALRQGEQRYQSLVRASAQIIWTTFPDGTVDDMPMWRAFTGQSAEEVRGLGWLNALHPDEREASIEAWRQTVAAGEQAELEYHVLRHDGLFRRLEVRCVPVLEEDGTLREWVGSCSDVTEPRHDAALLAGQKRVLEKIARGASLEETMQVLAEVVQE